MPLFMEPRPILTFVDQKSAEWFVSDCLDLGVESSYAGSFAVYIQPPDQSTQKQLYEDYQSLLKRYKEYRNE